MSLVEALFSRVRRKPRGYLFLFGVLTTAEAFTTFTVRAASPDKAFEVAEERVRPLKESGELLTYGRI